MSLSQRTYYGAAKYTDHPDRLLVVDGDAIELYSMDLTLAQYWYAAAWGGERFDTKPFAAKRIAWDLEPAEADSIVESGLVLAQCLRHGEGMPVVEKYNGQPIYGSAVEVLTGEVFEAALGHLIEEQTGIAGLTISPMHTRYALREGRPAGAAIGLSTERARGAPRDLLHEVTPGATVTIVVTDIVGSTALNTQLGDRRWMELIREHNELLRRELRAHNGSEVKTYGDAFMSAFAGAADALRFATAVQRALRLRNQQAETAIHIRIGAHVGEPVHEVGDMYGRAVTEAFRIASAADAGEIVLSSLVHALVEPSGDFALEQRGRLQLKGIPGRHVLYSLKWSDA